MKQAMISKITGPVDAAEWSSLWSALSVIPIDYVVHPTEAKIQAFAQIAYDDRALYLHLFAEEKNIRREMTDPLGSTCEDSCLEFFFRPDPQDIRYFNLEFNFNCVPFIGFGPDIEHLVRLFPLEDPMQAKAQTTENGWEVFYQVPYSFIRVFFPNFAPKSGDHILANFYKCGDKTEIVHYLAWTKPADHPHAFHCPECFGRLIFE